MITLTLVLEVNGRAKHIQCDALTPGDFTSGSAHILSEYLTPMSEIAMQAYRELSDRDDPASVVRNELDDRMSISRRLAQIGMV